MKKSLERFTENNLKIQINQALELKSEKKRKKVNELYVKCKDFIIFLRAGYIKKIPLNKYLNPNSY